MVVVLGLAAAIIYGAADFAGGFATRRTPALTVVVLSQLAGLVVLVTALAVIGQGPPPPGDVLRGAVAGIGGGAGVALLYRGLAVGRMSAVAPVTAVGAAVIPVLWGLATGERPSAWALAGVAVALVAVVLVSRTQDVDGRPDGGGVSVPVAGPGGRGRPAAAPRRARLAPGVAEAVLAGIAFGVFFIVLQGTSPDAGLWPLLGARSSVLVAGAAARVTGAPLRAARGQLCWIATAGVLDMAANVLYLVASRQGLLSVVAVLVSLYPATTVLLARVVLGERFGGVQRGGLALAAAGVALIALG